MADPAITQFDAASRRRIADAVRAHERRPQDRPQKRGRRYMVNSNLPRLGKANTAIAINTGAANNVDLWTGTPGSESSSSGITFTAYNKFGDIDSGAWVMCVHNGYGWYIIAAVCPA